MAIRLGRYGVAYQGDPDAYVRQYVDEGYQAIYAPELKPGDPAIKALVEAVAKAGLKYFNIPVVYTAPTDAQVDEFLTITDDKTNRPMFIHCTAAIRVGAFWAIRRAVRDGLTVDAALEDGRKVGLVNAPHLEEFVRKYVAAHPKK